ncbi:MAG: hypothetical protein ABI442_18645 [Gemmatimonadaceae bacterium]
MNTTNTTNTTNTKNRLIVQIGVFSLVVGAGSTLVPAYSGSSLMHFVSGLGLGLCLPLLIVGTIRARQNGSH